MTSAGRQGRAESERQYWQSCLEQHKQFSSQEENQMPAHEGSGWKLHCSRTAELSSLCAAFAEISQSRSVSISANLVVDVSF